MVKFIFTVQRSVVGGMSEPEPEVLANMLGSTVAAHQLQQRRLNRTATPTANDLGYRFATTVDADRALSRGQKQRTTRAGGSQVRRRLCRWC